MKHECLRVDEPLESSPGPGHLPWDSHPPQPWGFWWSTSCLSRCPQAFNHSTTQANVGQDLLPIKPPETLKTWLAPHPAPGPSRIQLIFLFFCRGACPCDVMQSSVFTHRLPASWKHCTILLANSTSHKTVGGSVFKDKFHKWIFLKSLVNHSE